MGLAGIGAAAATCDAPTITGIDPPSSGSVTIHGTNFTCSGSAVVTAVDFGTVQSTHTTVNGDTSITASVPPPGGSSTVTVTVTTADSVSHTTIGTTNPGYQYTYASLPVVQSVATSPASNPVGGPSSGGSLVYITGTGFSGVTTVTFGTVQASFNYVSDKLITAYSPTGSSGSTVDITITTSNGTSITSTADQFTYTPAPFITQVSPNTGSIGGGTVVTITGTALANVTGVKFGQSAPPVPVSSASATTVMVSAPPGNAGTVDLIVVTPSGNSQVIQTDQFTYVGPPVVSSISPATGPAAGSTLITITGTGFSGATAVHFGSKVVSGSSSGIAPNAAGTSLTVLSPAGTGTVDVEVETPGGISAAVPGDQFIYQSPPAISGVTPNGGSSLGGTSVTISGTNFTGATGVTFGKTAATTFTLNQNGTITAVAPAGSGTIDITVTTANGSSAGSTADQFVYAAVPAVTSISPLSGPTTGNNTVTINGVYFTSVTAVMFGGNAATNVHTVSSNQITATAPAGTGTVDITVVAAGGTSQTGVSDKYIYSDAPSVNAISPGAGPPTGGTAVVITGSNLSGASVSFGGKPGTVTLNTANAITAVSPAGTGTVDITITTSNGTSTKVGADQFTYTSGPSVTSVSPGVGILAGGTSVSITGTGFTGATAVKFGSTAATSYTVNTDSSITAVAPAGSGTVHVIVATPNGTSTAGTTDTFAYQAVVSAPTVSSVSPNSGSTAGGTGVTVTGTNFTNVLYVKFGTVAAAFTVAANSTTQITVTAPATAAASAVDVTVVTSTGTSATSAADKFTYTAPAAVSPTVTALSPSSGPTTGNTSVTITGTNFTGATSVKFAGVAAKSFTILSATSITALAPAGTGTADVTVTTSGGTSAVVTADKFSYSKTTSSLSLSALPNPATAGKPVTLTATVTGNSPTGTVTFFDKGVTLGTTALGNLTSTSGTATYTIASISNTVHSFAALYNGDANNTTADPVVPVLVDPPADSVALRKMQVSVTPLIAQTSGNAISGAIDGAIGAGFAGAAQPVSPNGSGFTYYFDADGDGQANAAEGAPSSPKDFFNNPSARNSRVNDDFNALGYAAPTKARPANSPRDWLAWIDVRGLSVDRTTAGSDLNGNQVNATAGLTRRLTSDFVFGVLGGYESFNFSSQAVNGMLKGSGWTGGGYLGWRIMPSVRFTAGFAGSEITNNDTTGTASGKFDGTRWLATAALTGTYELQRLIVEPSAQVYALWEKEGAYTDSLGTSQAARNFSTGRGSVGVKVAYPFVTNFGNLAPYFGLFGDYYFNSDNASLTGLTSTPLLQGGSARATFGLGLTGAGGAQVSAGGEYAGIGSNLSMWTWRVRAGVPF